jgi:UDP-glucose 4-epimerase
MVEKLNILITGANGLLSSELCKLLVLSGYNVTALYHVNLRETIPFVKYQKVDFTSHHWIDDLPSQLDCIIHLAQSSNFRDFPQSALDVFKVNIDSTAQLLDYGRKVSVKQFIYASSGGVYGNGVNPFNENAPLVPFKQLGFYLGSKACSEILIQSYASIFNVIILRPFFMYGPGQNRNMLIPRLMDSVANAKPIVLQGENGILINPIHVKDASSAVLAALSVQDSSTFNIAGPDILSIKQICEGMGEFLGIKPIFEFQLEKPNDLIGDISEMRYYLHNPKIHLLEVLDDINE